MSCVLSRNLDTKVECPFFLEAPSNARSSKFEAMNRVREAKRIRCEGLSPGGRLMLEFATSEEREGFCDDFCRSACWRGCPVALMLEDLKYDER